MFSCTDHRQNKNKVPWSTALTHLNEGLWCWKNPMQNKILAVWLIKVPARALTAAKDRSDAQPHGLCPRSSEDAFTLLQANLTTYSKAQHMVITGVCVWENIK